MRALQQQVTTSGHVLAVLAEWLQVREWLQGSSCSAAFARRCKGAARQAGTLVMAVLSSLMKGTQGITLLRSLGKLSLFTSPIWAIQGQWTSQGQIEIFFALPIFFVMYLCTSTESVCLRCFSVVDLKRKESLLL